MLTILALGALMTRTGDSDAIREASFKRPFISRAGTTFVEIGKIDIEKNLEIWRVPPAASNGQLSRVAGKQLAADLKDPHIVGEIPASGLLLITATKGETDEHRVYGIDPNTGETRNAFTAFEGNVLEAVVSNDGRTLAVVQTTGEEEQADVWSLDLNTWSANPKEAQATRLTNDASVEHDLAVSRDGMFASWTIGLGPSTLSIRELGSSRLRTINSRTRIYLRDFFPENKWLLLEEHDSSGTTMTSVVSWYRMADGARQSVVEYADRGARPLRAAINADGTLLSMIVPEGFDAGRPVPQDATLPIVVRLIQIDGFPQIAGLKFNNDGSYHTTFPSCRLRAANVLTGRYDLLTPTPPADGAIEIAPQAPISAATPHPLAPDRLTLTWSASNPTLYTYVKGFYPRSLPKGWPQELVHGGRIFSGYIEMETGTGVPWSLPSGSAFLPGAANTIACSYLSVLRGEFVP